MEEKKNGKKATNSTKSKTVVGKDKEKRERIVVATLIIVSAIVVGITSGQLIYNYFNNDNSKTVTEVATK